MFLGGPCSERGVFTEAFRVTRPHEPVRGPLCFTDRTPNETQSFGRNDVTACSSLTTKSKNDQLMIKPLNLISASSALPCALPGGELFGRSTCLIRPSVPARVCALRSRGARWLHPGAQFCFRDFRSKLSRYLQASSTKTLKFGVEI